MAATTEISWTDATFNPLIGCQKLSPGCKNCYAEADFDKRRGHASWGPNGTRVVTSDAYWKQPLKWNEKAWANQAWHSANTMIDPPRPRVFCASLADVFEDWRGPISDSKGKRLYWFEGRWEPHSPTATIALEPVTMGDVRDRLFKLIDATPNLDWLVLTKRPENIHAMWPRIDGDSFPKEWDVAYADLQNFDNIWLGTSVENQEYADKRIPELLRCRDLSPVLFLSMEPLLGPVDLTRVEGSIGIGLHSYDVLNGKNIHWDDDGKWTPCDKIDWVITGSESGPNARPARPDWYRSIRDQCNAAGVAYFHKQNGEFIHVDDAVSLGLTTTYDGKYQPYDHSLGVPMLRVGKKNAGRLLDGKIHEAFPVVN